MILYQLQLSSHMSFLELRSADMVDEVEDTYLAIHCENNHHEKIKKREGRFISSKPSSVSKANPLHGLGLISVTNNVNKYGGTIDINYNDTTFIVDILIPNYR